MDNGERDLDNERRQYCSGHGEDHDESEFSRDYSRRSGLTSSCRRFRAESRRQRRKCAKDMAPTDLRRFFSKVLDDACWIWNGAVNSKGYGAFSLGESVLSHRTSYEFFNQVDLADDLQIHHECGNTLCVNPTHLIALTQAEHTKETAARRRDPARGIRRTVEAQ